MMIGGAPEKKLRSPRWQIDLSSSSSRIGDKVVVNVLSRKAEALVRETVV